MAASQSFPQIMADLKKGIYKPVYILCGEEPFYTDQITDFIENNALTEAERDFNQSVFYGSDVDERQIVEEARRLPMMAQRIVIIVREAQHVKFDKIVNYLQKPQKSTVLVIAIKGKKPDGRTAFGKLSKSGADIAFLESVKVPDYNMGKWIGELIKSMGLSADHQALALMAEHLGADLSRVHNELNKLKVNLPSNTPITAEVVEKYIGISKEYSQFELANAILARDFPKAIKVARYFQDEAKNAPLLLTTSTLYGNFSKLLILHAEKVRSAEAASKILGMHSFPSQQLFKAMHNYSYAHCIHVISLLRKYDAYSKGRGGQQNANLHTELVTRICTLT